MIFDKLDKAKTAVLFEFMKRNSKVAEALEAMVVAAREKKDTKAEDVVKDHLGKILEAASVLPMIGGAVKPLLADALQVVLDKVKGETGTS